MSEQPSYLRCENNECGMYYNLKDVKDILKETNLEYNPEAELHCVRCAGKANSNLVRVRNVKINDANDSVFNLRDEIDRRSLKNMMTGNIKRNLKS